VASFRLFQAGAFSSDPGQPFRADAVALRALTDRSLADGFQVADDNPLIGLSGRAALLRRLGEALAAAPELFGAEPRVGGLFDTLRSRAAGGRLAAATVLEAVLRGFGSIWPGRIALAGTALGDVWRHPAAAADDLTDGLVPFHKLSQWLVYSLVEPLEAAGLQVTGLDDLTGLAEYRNGGLMIDCGVVVPKHPAVTAEGRGHHAHHQEEALALVRARHCPETSLDRMILEAVRSTERRLALTAEMKARAVPVAAPHFEELGI
jgi:hypothetical protein